METYNGNVRTPQDAIILFEACRLGLLPRVQRRLSEKERQQIKAGSVFVWDEQEAGMRRWTDGKSWSASRVSGSFLTYREMEGKRGGSSLSVSNQADSMRRTPDGHAVGPPSDSGPDSGDDGPEGYRYKPDGLMKQSFSITTQMNQRLHLISYFTRPHPTAPNLSSPSTDPALRHIRPQKGMYPESTVQEQHSIPAVTRTPLQSTGCSTTPQTAAYAKHSPATNHQNHSQAPAQSHAPSHHQPGYWPPQALLQNGHGQPNYAYQYQPSHPPSHQSPLTYPPSSHPPPQQHYPPPTHTHQPYLNASVYPDGRRQAGDAYQRSLGAYNDTLPPPNNPQHQRTSSSGSARGYYDSSSSHHTTPMIQQPTPPTPHQKTFDPSANPQDVHHAPRLSISSPEGQHLPSMPQQASMATPRSRSQSPLPPPRLGNSDRKGSADGIPKRLSTSASEASTRPSIGALMNGSSASMPDTDSKSDRSTSKSPRIKEDGVQYAPNDKLTYHGEDQRALRQLDRAFKT